MSLVDVRWDRAPNEAGNISNSNSSRSTTKWTGKHTGMQFDNQELRVTDFCLID